MQAWKWRIVRKRGGDSSSASKEDRRTTLGSQHEQEGKVNIILPRQGDSSSYGKRGEDKSLPGLKKIFSLRAIFFFVAQAAQPVVRTLVQASCQGSGQGLLSYQCSSSYHRYTGGLHWR